MVTLYNLGRSSGQWDTYFRTDCTAITKKPLKWGAKNLNAFDAVVFFTDGDLDMDDSQKADLLSFVRDDGKGFIGIHSATITFLSWPEYGKMIGGYFDGHPWGEFDAPLVVEDAELSRHGAPASHVHPQGRDLPDQGLLAGERPRAPAPRCAQGRPVAGKESIARTRTSRSSGPATTARGASSTTAWAIATRSGIGPRSRRCGSRWCQWSMGLIPGDATPRATLAK